MHVSDAMEISTKRENLRRTGTALKSDRRGGRQIIFVIRKCTENRHWLKLQTV